MTDSKSAKVGKIGIVTVTYNSEHVLDAFLDSVSAQTYNNIVLYLVDNASKDNTLEMVRQRSDLTIVIFPNLKNLGVAEGNNQGIRAALADECECVLLLNNDTIFPDDLIAQLYAGLDRYDCDMTTAKMYYYDKLNVIWCAGGHWKPWPWLAAIHDGVNEIDVGQYEEPRRVAYTPTCCLLARRTVFDRIGMMDNKYFVFYDDADFLFRSRHHGIVLWYVPKAKLWHKVGSLNEDLPEFADRFFARNHIYFVRKFMPGWQARMWYWFDQSRYALAFFLFRSTLAKWRVRRVAARDGWKMSLHS
jgi:hypothetical protein